MGAREPVQDFIGRVEAAQAELFAALAARPGGGLRGGLGGELGDELREIEAARVAGGQEPGAARADSWKRVKVLHGLGYPVDFGWLHGPVARAQ